MTTEPQVADRGVDFDVARLDAYLKDWFGGTDPTRVGRTHGGMSNPTYFITRGEWRAVLRKQPGNVLMPSAHAIDREYRVLTALQGSSVPTPEPYRYCEDREIVGTPFYLMEWLDGRVFSDFATPGVARGGRAGFFRSRSTPPAAIHRLDSGALGLGALGRPGNYFARQLKRWCEQWTQFRRGDDDNPALDTMVRWLAERLPESETIAL